MDRAQNGEQNNPLGVAKKGGLETKFEETAGQMTVGHIRSYKFVRLGLKGLIRTPKAKARYPYFRCPHYSISRTRELSVIERYPYGEA